MLLLIVVTWPHPGRGGQRLKVCFLSWTLTDWWNGSDWDWAVLRALHSSSRATRENKSRRRSHNISINQTSDHSRFNIRHHTRDWTIFLLGFMLYVCSNHRDCVTLPHSEMNSSVEWTEGQILSNLKPEPDPRADVEVFLLWYDLSDSLPVRLIQSCGSLGVFF